MLWYRTDFGLGLTDRLLGNASPADVINEAEAREAVFTHFLPIVRRMRRVTGIPLATLLAVFTIASDYYPIDRIDEYAEGVIDPSGDPEDPRRALAERMRVMANRERRRLRSEDWTMVTRSLNAFLHGDPMRVLRVTEIEPLVGERDAEYQRRLARHRRAQS